ncbi:MAG: tRNA uridine-5-carboxymethylaminomethyl(34) synthesis GTPase MnmE, partial [Defluviitaleaceae bacterium]|nr:tRNA uridine-5-carboxymethylaminomethyl(34) synthesis GTPase MnmE [Defluviitaleaceae bacterium]
MKFNLHDTIAAISTPLGGAISIIRISGSDALGILSKIFKTLGKKPFNFESHRIYYGWIYETQAQTEMKIDEVLATVMLAPKTFTRQDVVEINCHGSVIAARKILSLILSHGARHANPGEFSARAYLNGRIDLSQAEAIMDLINAKSQSFYKAGLNQLEGHLGDLIRKLCDTLLTLLARIEMAIDYPEY